MFKRKVALGKFLFDYLHKEGINDAFGIPGDFVLPAFRHLEKSKINVITMTHEPSVGFAADAYARINGLGMAIVTYCVGGLNMLNAVACAYAEKSPVIVISGGPSPLDRQKDPMVHHKVRDFDSQKRIYEEVTCASTILLDPETAAAEIMRVVEEVKRQKRPGYIEIPFDLVDHEIILPKNSAAPISEQISDPEILEACLKQIAKKINNAKQPVIVAGIELQRYGLTDLASKLAGEYNIPIAATLLAKSVIKETNPLYIGVYSGVFSEPKCKEYIDSSDCVILLGAFISDVLLGFHTDKIDRKKAIILSTDKIQVGLQSYEDIEFKDILQGMVESKIKPRKDFKNPNPTKLYNILEQSEKKSPLNVESLFEILSTHLIEGSTVVCDTGDALIGAIGLRTDMRSHFLSDAYYLSMGFAAPACIGAMVANPDSKTFAIIGDGAFQMTGTELSTAAKYKLAPIVIIINNDGYGTQRHIVDGDFNNIHMWNYTKLCEMLNYGKAVRAHTKGDFDKALIEAVDYEELYLIEAIVPRDDCSKSLRRMGEALHKLRNPG